jgi:adenylosuccinate lyase
MFIPDVLADRYVTEEVGEPYSPIGKQRRIRDFWISVMNYQRQLGIDIPQLEIDKFVAARNNINLERIRELEKSSRHEIDAWIKAFIEVAGAGEYLHLGMTSRDLTDNVEQKQILDVSKFAFRNDFKRSYRQC